MMIGQAGFVRGALVAAVLGLAACGGGGGGQSRVTDDTPVAQIMAMAEAEIARGRLRQAADIYMELERLYPFTAEAQLALIRAASAYHDGNRLIESRVAAQRYLGFFPRGANADLAQYLVALSYYDQIVDVQRDQQRTFRALQEFRTLIEQFPNSQYVALAQPKFATALNQLAGKEMDVGRYYLARGNFSGAINRFLAVVNDYGETPHRAEALHRLVESYLSLGLGAQAAEAAGKLAAQYPDSYWARAAQSLIATGRQPDAGGRFRRN